MYRHFRFVLLVLLALTSMLLVSPANAGGASCNAVPTSGPPGTAFTISCSGFSPNTIVNTYVVEPDGRALGGMQVYGFASNIGGGSVVTGRDGKATFTWQSAGGGMVGFAHQLGRWTWVVHQLGQGGTIIAEGQTSINLIGKDQVHSGAILTVTPPAGKSFDFTGSGFAGNENVSIWVTLPFDCSGRFDVEGASAVDPVAYGVYEGISGPNSAKADRDGNINFSLVFAPEACRGEYWVTARALGSGIGGEVVFRVTGDAISTNAMLAATPEVVAASAPFVNLLGSGFTAGSKATCWTTRPDGRAFDVGTVTVAPGGTFALRAHISNFDSLLPYATEEPGIWYVTCRTQNGDRTAATSFLVTSLPSDP